MNDVHLAAKDCFEIGGEELLSSVQAESPSAGSDTQKGAPGDRQRETLEDIRVRIGTLLKTETISLLLGAGSSVDCGGQLVGVVPLRVERDLINEGITGMQRPRLRRWLRVLYLAVRCSGGGDSTPVTREEILARREALNGGGAEPLQANFEQVLATLHRWRSALPETGGRLRVDGMPLVDTTGDALDACLSRATLVASKRNQGRHLFTTSHPRKLLSQNQIPTPSVRRGDSSGRLVTAYVVLYAV